MDSRVTAPRERIERVREALARHGAQAVLVLPPTRTCRNTCPSAGRGGSGCRLHRLDGHAGRHARSRGAVRRQPLLGAGRSRARRQRDRARQGAGPEARCITSTGSPRSCSAARRCWPTPRCWAWPARSCCARRSTRRACRSATTSTCWTRSGRGGPALPERAVYEHRAPQADSGRRDRLARVREAVAAHGATHHFVSSVDDIAWITNLRGGDVEYNPVFLAHLLVDAQARDAVRRRRQDRRPVGGAARGRRHHARRLCGRHRGAARAARAQRAAGRPQARDARLPPVRARRVRVVEAINPSTLFKSRKTDARPASCARR